MIRSPRDSDSVERYLDDIASVPPLTDGERGRVFAEAFAGNGAARERIILAHLAFAAKIASRYAGYGLPLADLISEANLGLVRAAELFNPAYGTDFTTYASVWMKQRIHRAISAQAGAVRVPVWRSQRLRKLDRLHEELSAELGKDATFDELAERLGLETRQVEQAAQDRITTMSVPLEEDANFRAEGPGPADRLSQEELLAEIGACLDELTDDELRVISSKFGLRDEAPQSYREMAPAFGRSREWIRRLGEDALRKLRHALASAGSLPRALVSARRRKALERLEKLARKPAVQKLSVLQLALIQWMEPLITNL